MPESVAQSPALRRPVSGFLRHGAIVAMTLILGACTGPGFGFFGLPDKEFINNQSKFSVSEFGVAASPRVTTSRQIRRGGGRAVVGKPYKVAGKWYYPRVETDYDKIGTASWYGPNFQGRLTANGEIFDQYFLSAAHPTLPLPSYVQVRNLANGRTVTVRVNDRGPFANNRMIDLSRRAAEVLGFIKQGTARVRVTYIGPAPVEGDDSRYLLASINRPAIAPSSPPSGQPANGQQGRTPSIISRQNGGIFGAVVSLFSYAGPQQGELMISNAHEAANAAAALAGSRPELAAWLEDVQKIGNQNTLADAGPSMQSTPVSIYLGTYSDRQFALELARRFALYGAVNATYDSSANNAIRLEMVRLKAGVLQDDVQRLAREMGL